MKYHESLISSINEKLPELVSVSDLMRIGFYRTHQAARMARKRGKCPPYFRIPSRGIVYPRNGLITFLEKKMQEFDAEEKTKNGQISHSDAPRLLQKEKDEATYQ